MVQVVTKKLCITVLSKNSPKNHSSGNYRDKPSINKHELNCTLNEYSFSIIEYFTHLAVMILLTPNIY